MATPWRPLAATRPNSAIWLRNGLISMVRWRISMSCSRCDTIRACWAGRLTGTKRIDGRVAASQIASASTASFLPRLTNPFT